MKRIDITFILSLWGAIVSTILFILAIVKFRKEIKGKIEIISKFSSDFELLSILIKNPSFRPVTLLSYDILYAANDVYFQIIKSFEFEKSVKVTESDNEKLTFQRSELITSTKENDIEQKYYHTLKIRIYTTNSGTFLFDLPVPESIIQIDCHKLARSYVATDIYLGFQPKEPVSDIRGKMHK
jgi:hypothetical protein